MAMEQADELASSEVPQLASHVRLAVSRLGRRLRSEHDPGNELSLGQLSILRVLYLNGESTMGELAAHERVQPPAVTRTVTYLEDAGFVRRHTNKSDGRQVVVTLTGLGRRMLAIDAERRNEWLARRLGALTPEQRDLLGKAATLMDELAEE
jgi:DNA-binding MarR family transcriptional regulator